MNWFILIVGGFALFAFFGMLNEVVSGSYGVAEAGATFGIMVFMVAVPVGLFLFFNRR